MSDILSKIMDKCNMHLDHGENFGRILSAAERSILNSPEPVLEIGTNKGGSALAFLYLIHFHQRNNWVYTVDPYGSIPYEDDGGITPISQYSNARYRRTMLDISELAYLYDLNHQHFKCTSEFFFENYKKFQQFENGQVKNFDKFSFIFLDGSHNQDVVEKELNYALDCIDDGGAIVVDDVQKTFRGKLKDLAEAKHTKFSTCGNTKDRLMIYNG